MIVFIVPFVISLVVELVLEYRKNYHHLGWFSTWLGALFGALIASGIIGGTLFLTVVPESPEYQVWSRDMEISSSGNYFTKSQTSDGERYFYLLRNGDGTIGQYSVRAALSEVKYTTDGSQARFEAWKADTDMFHKGMGEHYIFYIPGGG